MEDSESTAAKETNNNKAQQGQMHYVTLDKHKEDI